jgi:hypothetical protein
MKKLVLFILIIFQTMFGYSQWSQKYYVDDFGDKSHNSYIQYRDINGYFSNSATSGSKLISDFTIYFDNNTPEVSFYMYEYGNSNNPSVGCDIGGKVYLLTIKLSDNTTDSYSLSCTEDYLYMDNRSEDLIEYLRKEKSLIKCNIKVRGDYSNQSYNFKINPIGFSAFYSKIKPKYNPELFDNGNNQNFIATKNNYFIKDEEKKVFSIDLMLITKTNMSFERNTILFNIDNLDTSTVKKSTELHKNNLEIIFTDSTSIFFNSDGIIKNSWSMNVYFCEKYGNKENLLQQLKTKYIDKIIVYRDYSYIEGKIISSESKLLKEVFNQIIKLRNTE